MAVTIVELDAAGVRVRLDALAELLLDAHESGMALGLAAPLSRGGARGGEGRGVAAPLSREDARDAYERAAARLAPGERLLLAALEGGEVVGAVQLDRAEAEN